MIREEKEMIQPSKNIEDMKEKDEKKMKKDSGF